MNLRRVWVVFLKDLAVGPRSPLLVFMVVLPLVMTLVLNLVFGTLSSDAPRLAVYDEAGSEVDERLEAASVLRISRLATAGELRTRVLAHDYDAGLILPAGFDALVRSGAQPELQLLFSGESYAMDRMTLAVQVLDAVRAVEGKTPPVEVALVEAEEGDPVPLFVRFIPVLVLYAFMIAGLFVPASLLVEEKEKKTLVALLCSPARMGEVVLAKALLGVVLAFALAAVTLLINRVQVESYGALFIAMLVSAVFWALLGVLIGLVSRSSEMLFAIVKGTGVLLMGPVVFYLFPDWPQWIARFFPTYWAIDPLWQLVANDAGLAELVPALGITMGMCVVLALPVAALGRRAMKQLG